MVKTITPSRRINTQLKILRGGRLGAGLPGWGLPRPRLLLSSGDLNNLLLLLFWLAIYTFIFDVDVWFVTPCFCLFFCLYGFLPVQACYGLYDLFICTVLYVFFACTGL